jgi:hypothetical protein
MHYFQDTRLPPGAVGAAQLLRGGPLEGYVQPVQFRGPPRTLISIAQDGQFTDAEVGVLHAGLLVGQIYRLRVSNIPGFEEFEIYPSLEVLNRLYPPEGQRWRFPIPIEFTQEELELAIDGQLVTRVIYLEDPRAALPAAEPNGQRYFEVAADQNPLEAADRLGRPMAILRMGSRVPDFDANTGQFQFHCPPLVQYAPPPPLVQATDDDISRGLERGLEGQNFSRLPDNR